MKKLITLSLLTSAALMAATPTTGDILRQVEPVKLPEMQKELPSLGSEYKAPLEVKDEFKTYVKSFKFSGNSVIDSKTLSTLVKPYEGKELGINALKEVASLITKYYRDHGYFVARAYIPAQSMENGVVEIAVIEGSYGAFEMKNSSHVKTQEVQGFMDQLKSGEKVSTMSLERQMLLINDLSGAQVTNAEVFPGQKVGTSDFRITVSPTQKYSAYAVVDNYGSRYTGEERLSAGVSVNSLTGIGDTLTLSGLVSNTKDLKNGRLAYDRPLGYSGLKGGVSASITDYTLSEISNYDASGQTNTYSAYISYPFLKTRAHTTNVELDIDHKDMKDTSGATGATDLSRKKIDAMTLKLSDTRSTSLANTPGQLYASLAVVGGRLYLDKAVTGDVALNTEGTYTKATLNLNHNQYLSPLFNLQTSLKAQKSFGKNLDSSEDISVGGSNGVRAYEDSELSGDQGYYLSLELGYKLPNIQQISHSASLFIDHAEVWKNTTIINSDKNERSLDAIGLGYTMNFKSFDLKASYAHGFGGESKPVSESEFSTNKDKFLVQGIVRF